MPSSPTRTPSAPPPSPGRSSARGASAAHRADSSRPSRRPDDRSVDLYLGDLELGDRPLLDHAQEMRLGRRIQAGLRRLHRLLLAHPEGRERYARRLRQAAEGEMHVHAWGSDRRRLKRNATCLVRDLRASGDRRYGAPRRSAAFRAALRVVDRLPLDAELLLGWCERLAAPSLVPASREPSRVERVERLLRVAVSRVLTHRDDLSTANLRLVLREALRFRPAGMLRSDLFQEGFLGVQKAALRYDPARKLRFSTYATFWVKQAIRHSLLHNSRVIRVPERAQERVRKHQSGKDVTLDETEAARVLRVMHQTVMFSSVQAGSDDQPLDFADAPQTIDPEAVSVEALPGIIREGLGRLSPRQRRILVHRFGLEGRPRRTLEAIGEEMSLSRERVRQIEQEALSVLAHEQPLAHAWDDIVSYA